MTTVTKNRFKPKFKSLLRLRENIQNHKKLLNFRKKKWKNLIFFSTRKLKWYKKFKSYDQSQYLVSRYSNKGNAYAKNFRNTLNAFKKLSYFYGNLSKKMIKKQLNFSSKNFFSDLNVPFIELIEKRLDIVLYRAKFVFSIRGARQLISHKKILVNNKIITNKSYLLKKGDLISINNNSTYLIRKNIRHINIWPIPPKYLYINYKTMEIIVGNLKDINFSNLFNFHLNLEKILLDYKKY